MTSIVTVFNLGVCPTEALAMQSVLGVFASDPAYAEELGIMGGEIRSVDKRVGKEVLRAIKRGESSDEIMRAFRALSPEDLKRVFNQASIRFGSSRDVLPVARAILFRAKPRATVGKVAVDAKGYSNIFRGDMALRIWGLLASLNREGDTKALTFILKRGVSIRIEAQANNTVSGGREYIFRDRLYVKVEGSSSGEFDAKERMRREAFEKFTKPYGEYERLAFDSGIEVDRRPFDAEHKTVFDEPGLVEVGYMKRPGADNWLSVPITGASSKTRVNEWLRAFLWAHEPLFREP